MNGGNYTVDGINYTLNDGNHTVNGYLVLCGDLKI